MTVVLILIAVVVVVVLYAWYAGIVQRKNRVGEALSGVDVQLTERSSLIPNLLAIAKRFMEHEKDLLEEITTLRAKAGAAAGVDYLAFGAVYPSPTKPHAPRAGLDLLRRAKAELGLPVAAIGGITLDNAPSLVAAGASLLAVISDVFSAPDPAARATAYAGLFERSTQEPSA